MAAPAPWRDRDTLAPLVAAWRDRVLGRPLFRIMAGPGWVSLHLEGDERYSMLLASLPGAVLATPFTAPLPEHLRTALSPTKGHPLPGVMRHGRLVDVALLADDIVLHLAFETPAGPRLMRHQLFGSRGSTVVLEANGRVLWTAQPNPHHCLLDPAAPLAEPAAPGHDLQAWSDLALFQVARQRETELGDRLRGRLTRKHQAAERLAVNLQKDLDKADGGDARRRDAETLAASLHTVHRGQESVDLTDPHDGSSRTVDLDPALAPHTNLERLFKLARKAERGRNVIAERLSTAQADLIELTSTLTELGTLLQAPESETTELSPVLERLAALQAFARANPELEANRLGPITRAPEEPSRPFRRYLIDGRWEAWVGRSSKENDELTHRASHTQDLWLHAQGVTGSHVILRTNGRPDLVPATVLEKAAALAALHSKARNSSYVPVIWTERRYVRRPRKAAPGTAVCLREKNLFVEPGIMNGVVPA